MAGSNDSAIITDKLYYIQNFNPVTHFWIKKAIKK
jgi:hypothetical protein